jgi:hypothetical protein
MSPRYCVENYLQHSAGNNAGAMLPYSNNNQVGNGQQYRWAVV